MKNYDGLKLRPLFYSEISSSFMIYEIFKKDTVVAKDFLKHFFEIDSGEEVIIIREKNYPQKGSIDIFLSFKINGIKSTALIEVKVHDYLSVSEDQIRIYYEAALEELGNDNVYFMYLTQFNRNNFPGKDGITLPDSIRVFEKTINNLQIPEKKIKHISWLDFHNFMDFHTGSLPEEYKLILELQKNWITAKSKEDLQLNKTNVGVRELSYYFKDVNIDLFEEFGSSNTEFKNNKEILTLDLLTLNTDKLDRVINIIKKFSSSANIDRSTKFITEENTLIAVKEFLKTLSESEDNWELLSFYSSLFDFVNKEDALLLHGTGTRGFSIKTKIKKKGFISICTLWSNKKIDFSIKR